jgi:hypothetical protein
MWKSSLSNAINYLIPIRLRRNKIGAWLKVYLSYIDYLHEGLKEYRDQTLRIAHLTPQVKVLEKYLNDRFNVSDIYITDGEDLGPWLFDEWNIYQFYLDESYIFSEAEIPSFVVVVPSSLEGVIQEIAAIVNKYKLPGKKFIIYKIAI